MSCFVASEIPPPPPPPPSTSTQRCFIQATVPISVTFILRLLQLCSLLTIPVLTRYSIFSNSHQMVKQSIENFHNASPQWEVISALRTTGIEYLFQGITFWITSELLPYHQIWYSRAPIHLKVEEEEEVQRGKCYDEGEKKIWGREEQDKKRNDQWRLRDVNGIIKNSLEMPGSRGNALVGGPRGPLGEAEFSHCYSLKIGLSWTEVG